MGYRESSDFTELPSKIYPEKPKKRQKIPDKTKPVTGAPLAKLRAYRKTLGRGITLEQEAVFLIGLQAEMSGG